VPSCINGIVWLTMQGGGGGMGRLGDQAMATAVLQLSSVVGKILLGVAIVCGLDSLRPRRPTGVPPAEH
jgi:alpha-D-ribose 1-methylphosphonate 5-triphosphate synthase subunit PhnG